MLRNGPYRALFAATRQAIFTLHSPFASSWIRRSASSQAMPLEESSRTSNTNLSRTALYELHQSRKGKLVPFGGFELPIQYEDLSIKESHLWTRKNASLFDVGHILMGPAASRLLEKITPLSTSTLQIGCGSLSCILHEATGGIVDDTIISRLGSEEYYMVTNAACRAKVLKYIRSALKCFQPGDLIWRVKDDWGLLALQGPLSEKILSEALQSSSARDSITNLFFGQCRPFDVPELGINEDQMLVSRGGYTGEDGFEISIAPPFTRRLADHLLRVGGQDRLRLAGLAARDSLRLEAGMCLYGHDLDDSTTPVEASLAWVVGKDRREGPTADFNGSDVILKQLRPRVDGGGVNRKRVGLVVKGAPAREGAPILNSAGEKIGNVTSGCPSPSLNENIAMGYVAHGHTKIGSQVQVLVRGKAREAKIARMPFVPSKYYKL